jgi:hypothetical protein
VPTTASAATAAGSPTPRPETGCSGAETTADDVEGDGSGGRPVRYADGGLAAPVGGPVAAGRCDATALRVGPAAGPEEDVGAGLGPTGPAGEDGGGAGGDGRGAGDREPVGLGAGEAGRTTIEPVSSPAEPWAVTARVVPATVAT